MNTKRKQNLAFVATAALACSLALGYTAPVSALVDGQQKCDKACREALRAKVKQAQEAIKEARAVRVKAPEIDAAAGVQAIALLSGVLLLVGERARRRKDLG